MQQKSYNRIIVVTDGLPSSEPTHETGLNLARRNKCPVTLVDTVRPPSTIARWFSANVSDVFEMVFADKKNRLEEYAQTFRDEGIETEAKVLLGKSSEVITREAIDSEASLVVRYMKGVHSKFSGNVGNTARGLMRICPAPVLLVNQVVLKNPKVVACLDPVHENGENQSIIDEAHRLSGANSDLYGLYCWEMYGSDLLEKRMSPQAFEESVRYTKSMYQKVFDEFIKNHDTSMFGGGIEMQQGQPSFAIPRYCCENKVDVAVMCSATLHHPLRRYFGSTVEAMLEKLPCALLAVKPVGFVSPLETAGTAEVAV